MDSRRKYRDRSPVDMRGRRTNKDRDSDTATMRAKLLDQLHRLANFISMDDPGLCEEDLVKLKQRLNDTEKFVTRGLGITQRVRNKVMMDEGRSNREYQKAIERKRPVDEDEKSSCTVKQWQLLSEKRQKVGRGANRLENERSTVKLAIPQAFEDTNSVTQRSSATVARAATTLGHNINMPSSAMFVPDPATPDRHPVDLSFTLIFRAGEVSNLPLGSKDQTPYIRVPTPHVHKYAPFLSGIFSANRSPQWHAANNQDDQYVYDPRNTALTKSYIRSKVVYINRVIESKSLMPLGDGRYDAAKLGERQRWAMLQRLVRWIASGDSGAPRAFEPPLSNRERRNILLLAETLQCDDKEFLKSVFASGY